MFVFLTPLETIKPILKMLNILHPIPTPRTHKLTMPTVDADSQMMALLPCALVTPYVSVFLNRHK